MSKRMISLLICIALAVTAAIAGTIAWLTDEQYDVNIMTMGNVKIEQNEYGSLTDHSVPFTDVGMMPGKTVIKNVEVTNIGASPAYVRTVVAAEWPATFSGNEVTLNWAEGVIAAEVDGIATISEVPYKLFYVDYPLAAGQTLENLLESVTMNGTADNADLEAIGEQYTVLVASQAVQQEGFANHAAAMAGSFYPTPISATNHPWVSGKQPADRYISTAQGLRDFAAEVNAGNSFKGKQVILTADIDLANVPWTPIGQTGATQFLGEFDGGSHTIKNLKVDSSEQTGEYYSSGLFGWVEAHGDSGDTGVIKNLTIDGAEITGHHNVAAIAGYLYGTVENCHVKNAKITNTHANNDACGDKTGCIVGYLGEDAKVKGCTATDCTVKGGRDAGQIVGAAKEACVVDCTATSVTVEATGGCTGANVNAAVIGRVL